MTSNNLETNPKEPVKNKKSKYSYMRIHKISTRIIVSIPKYKYSYNHVIPMNV